MSILSWLDANLPLLWLISAAGLLGALGWLVSFQLQFARLRRRYQTLMQGGDNRNLGQVLDDCLAKTQAIAARTNQLDSTVRQLGETSRLALQHVGVVRYDAFDDVGGRQSFAIALLDDRGDGVVISSLAARQATRIYAKPIHGWQADYTLTEEEKQALAQAAPQR